jgi:hypothetical protein
MPTAILIPLEVFGFGFIISMMMAVMIKSLMVLIKRITKNESK